MNSESPDKSDKPIGDGPMEEGSTAAGHQLSLDLDCRPDRSSTPGDFKPSYRTEIFNEKEFLVFTDQRNVYKLPNTGNMKLQTILRRLEFGRGERPIFITGTTDYSGFLLLGFENGTMAKVSLTAYKTKTQRKKLKNAYHAKDKLIFMDHISEDMDVALICDNDHVMVVHTENIKPRNHPESAAMKVMQTMPGQVVEAIRKTDRVDFGNPDHYRCGIPGLGKPLRTKDKY